MKNYLYDKDFLVELDNQHNKEIYTKIIALNFDEYSIEEITGRVSQGSISIDGTSAIRRTCSLTLVANELNIHEYYWGLNTKIKIEVGVSNSIDSNYDDIIWFPQGIFLITSFSTSQSTNSYTISIQGKDKMALLNGDIGGSITALSVDFGTYDIISSDGTTTTKKYLLKDIITEAVHEYAKEPFQNIIVNDLDDLGVELLEYRGNKPLYLVVDIDSDTIINLTLDFPTGYLIKETLAKATINEDDGTSNFIYDQRINNLSISTNNATILTSTDEKGNYIGNYTIIKAEKGDVIGYRSTELTYAGDLICNVGESITSMLDKIKSMLGEYEYFYNLDGQFVFQKKKTYTTSNWNPIENVSDEKYVDSAAYTSAITYYFENANIVKSFSNSPDFANLKNDYSIWGKRTSASGTEIPIHLRYAIDKKPEYYKAYNEVVYTTECPSENYYESDDEIIYTKNEKATDDMDSIVALVDWREIIYQMGQDYKNHMHDDDFYTTIRENNINYYPTGYTGYEQYYTDMNSFWRQIYNPFYSGTYSISAPSQTKFTKNPSNYYYYEIAEEYNEKISDYYVFDTDNNLYNKVIGVNKNSFSEKTYYILINCETSDDYKENIEYYIKSDDEYDADNKFAVEVKESPELLNFWFDFLDTDGDLVKYSVYTIGDRPKSENDDDVKAIYFRDIPDIIFLDNTEFEITTISKYQFENGAYFILSDNEYILVDNYNSQQEYYENKQYIYKNGITVNDIGKEYNYYYYDNDEKSFKNVDVNSFDNTKKYFIKYTDYLKQNQTGYTLLRLPDSYDALFTLSSQGKSAMDKLDDFLYNYSYCAESISMTTIPIYYLEPNVRIFVRDDNSGINGEYIVTRLTLPLTYNGTMNISATKAIDKLK